MNDESTTKTSRRDALKVLVAAAGTTALFNIPRKWIKPQLEADVLPAHARTSPTPTPTNTPTVQHTLTVGANQTVSFCFDTSITSTVTISPADSGIPMKYTINADPSVTISSPLTGTASTDASGGASVTFTAADITGTGNIRVTWEFANASDGTGSGTQTFFPAGC
jgi:hypothetical protein